MVDYWWGSDFHWNHDKVIVYSNRPFPSVEEMNEKLIENWNACVKPTDTIFQLGDFSFGKYQDIRLLLKRLNGYKHFILGNHDKVLAKNRYELLKDGLVDTIQDYLEWKPDKTTGIPLIVMFHYALRTFNKAHYNAIHCFGHSHGTMPPLGKSVDVGIDAKFIIPRDKQEDYRPIHLDELLDWAKKQEFVATDRHLPKEKKPSEVKPNEVALVQADHLVEIDTNQGG